MMCEKCSEQYIVQIGDQKLCPICAVIAAAAKIMRDYGTVDYQGKTYALTQDAYPENYRTDGEVRYYASATGPDGAEYEVAWETTQGWNTASAEAKRVEELLAEQRYGYLDEAEETELATLLDSPNTSWLDDESNACDWDRPIDVRRVWTEEVGNGHN
jgi:hypothetical protein